MPQKNKKMPQSISEGNRTRWQTLRPYVTVGSAVVILTLFNNGIDLWEKIQAQISVTSGPLQNVTQPYYSTFKFKNNGQFSLINVDPYCFIYHAEAEGGLAVFYQLVHSPTELIPVWDAGEPKTIVCGAGGDGHHTQFDMAVILEYSYFGFRNYKVSRWIGRRAPSGPMRLEEQPAGDVLEKRFLVFTR
jgi:hypothetical protein